MPNLAELREVNDRYPFDEQSEERLLFGMDHKAGAFQNFDPNRLRGVRDRTVAATLWWLWKRIDHRERTGEGAKLRERQRRDRDLEEMRSLRVLAQDAFAGSCGKDGKALAHRILVNDEGKKLLDDRERLKDLREALKRLRAEKSKQGSLL